MKQAILESQSVVANTVEEVRFNGRAVPLKTERLQAIFKKITASHSEIAQISEFKPKIGKENLLIL